MRQLFKKSRQVEETTEAPLELNPQQTNKRERISIKDVIKNRKGYTLLQILITVAILIALVALTNPLEMIQKTIKGRATTSWITDLNGITNDVATGRTKTDFLYGVTARNADGNYEITLPAPPASSSKSVTEQIIGADESFKYGANGLITYSHPASLTGMTVSNYATTSPSPAATGITVKGLTKSGSTGIPHIANKALPDIEKNLVLGLLGGQDTKIGKDIVKSKKATMLAGTPSAGGLLETILGGVDKYNYETSDNMDRWFNLVPVDQDALRKLSGTKSRFTDKAKYRLYYVSRVNTKDEAVALFADTATDAVAKNAVEELYEAATKSLRESDIVVIPVTKSEMVYSENSEFKIPKFSSND